jgi:hypothetical protein
MQKKKNGISLIALIITIIILLILAGISVTAVLGDNGIFKMSQKASDKTKDSSVVEEIELAWTARLSEYLEEHSKNETLVKSDFFVLDSLNDELTSGIISNYKYKENGETSFTYTDNSTGTQYGVLVNKKGKATVISRNEKIVEDSYLVDVVQVGDYVDIGLDYQNCMDFYGEYTIGGEELYGEKGPTGWRVLSKTGSGKNGYVTLVSAGTPFTYLFDNEEEKLFADIANVSIHLTESTNTIYVLNNMYPKAYSVSSTNRFGWTGFGNNTNDLTQIFGVNKYIDTSKGIHALMAGTNVFGYNNGTAVAEIENLYKTITDEKNIPSIKSLDYFYGDVGYENTVFSSSELGLTLEDKTVDFLCNGMSYFLGGSSYISIFGDGDEDDLFGVNRNGILIGVASAHAGIRPVITLKTGIQVSDDNTGNGYYGSPYTLKYDD